MINASKIASLINVAAQIGDEGLKKTLLSAAYVDVFVRCVSFSFLNALAIAVICCFQVFSA